MRIAAIVLVLLCGVTGCHWLRQTVDPVPVSWYQYGESRRQALLVLLPGLGDGLGAFNQAGFMQALQNSGLEFDAVEVDAHFGYYRTGKLATALHRDVVIPARLRGYRRIVLLGVSMGGYGALWYNHDHPGVADQLLLFAPFLGDEGFIKQLQQSGVDPWYRSRSEPFSEEERVWRWIVEDLGPGATLRERTVLAYGRGDKFAQAAELFARRLTPAQVVTGEGQHDWMTWLVLWRQVLDAGLLNRD